MYLLYMKYDAIALENKFTNVWSLLDEKSKRLFAANEAISLGYGGISVVKRACGLSRKAITKGITVVSG